VCQHFASETSKHAKHRSLMPTGDEPHPFFACRMPAHVFRSAHVFWKSMHFASERSKHAKLTGGEPTNNPYTATKAKLSLSKRTLLAGWHAKLPLIKAD
jgi:hypothetical protein